MIMNEIQHTCRRFVASVLLSVLLFNGATNAEDNKTVRVFIFAGQSNMVGSDSKVKDIQSLPTVCGTGECPTRRQVLLLHRPRE